MEIRIRLTEGEFLDVEADPAALSAAFATAVRSGAPLELHGAAGRVLAVNPAQVLWWERAPWADEEPARVEPLPRAAASAR
jgi:hypothetical protein